MGRFVCGDRTFLFLPFPPSGFCLGHPSAFQPRDALFVVGDDPPQLVADRRYAFGHQLDLLAHVFHQDAGLVIQLLGVLTILGDLLGQILTCSKTCRRPCK